MKIIDKSFKDKEELTGFINQKVEENKRDNPNGVLFFTTERFSDIIKESLKIDQKIDQDLIIKVDDYWCVKGEHSVLHLALGVSKDNPLIILTANHVKIPKELFVEITDALGQADVGNNAALNVLKKIADSTNILESE